MNDLVLHFLKSSWSDVIIMQHKDEICVIDTGFDGQYPQIAEYIKNLDCNKISFVILTHFHNDHYGSLENLVKNFKIDKVYMKDYNALDYTNSDGEIATDEYRKKELSYFKTLKQLIEQRSKLINLEIVSSISWGELSINVHNNKNLILRAYNDRVFPSFHTFKYNENVNSIALSLEYLGKTILLGGDILDKDDVIPYVNKINLRVAEQINKEIDIYKVPHHGEDKSTSKETLNVYKPKLNIITNSLKYVRNETSTLENIHKAYKDSSFLFTDKKNVIVSVNHPDGNIQVRQGNELKYDDILKL